jgi:NADPH2:quinone reductase
MADANSMRALVMTGFGPPGKHIAVQTMPLPACKANDLLIRVAAAGVNPVDWKECEGFLQPFYGVYERKWIPGYDAAGVVERVGANVSGFGRGDRVVLFSDRRDNGHNGTFADYVRVLANAVAKVPAQVDLREAAAIPTAALTGYQALIAANKASLKTGNHVLIHGASGGVGSYAVQFAKSAGLKVAATCRAQNADFVTSLGADRVIDYSGDDIARSVRRWAPEGVHAIIDCVSGGTLPDAFDALRAGGKLISIATLTQDGDIAAETSRAAERGCEKLFSIMNFDRIGEELGEILALMARGEVKSPPLTPYSLDRGAEALEHMKRGGVRGKIVITM